MESDHASKVREARDARRKRILAKSSERFAYITGEGKNSPLSSPSASFREFDPSPEARKSDVSRSLGFQKRSDESSDQSGIQTSGNAFAATNCVREMDLNNTTGEFTQESGDVETKALCNSERKEIRKIWLPPSGNICSPAAPDLSPATTPQPQEYSSPFLNTLSHSIQDSLLPRVVCAACVAILFVGAATLISCSHPWGIKLNLYTSLWPIAVVFAMDFVLALRVLRVSPWEREVQQKKLAKGSLEQGTKGTSSIRVWDVVAILTEVMVAVSLDCGIYIFLEGGGLSIARYCLSTSCSFNRT